MKEEVKSDVSICRLCPYVGDKTYDFIYKCKFDGIPRHSVVRCHHIYIETPVVEEVKLLSQRPSNKKK